jgi:hypothetical protein
MKDSPEVSDWCELKLEIEALRKRLDELEATQSLAKTAGRAALLPRIYRWPAWALAVVIVTLLPALGALNATNIEEALHISPNGNVGIGTSSPAAKLQVNGNTKVDGRLTARETLVSGGVLGFDGAVGPANLGDFSLGHAAGYSWIQSYSQHPLALNPVGNNVGIGTAKPMYLLQVGDSTVNSDGKISIGRKDSSGDRNMVLGYNSDSAYDFGLLDSGNKMQFGVNWQAPANSLYISKSGNVGIGKKDPSARLDVLGDVKLGADGSMFASASGENLYILRGRVTSDGQKVSGADAGFTVQQHPRGTGAYYIKFETPFKGIPSASVNEIYRDNSMNYSIGDTRDNAIIVHLDAGLMEIGTGGNDGKPQDREFTFVVIGQRN